MACYRRFYLYNCIDATMAWQHTGHRRCSLTIHSTQASLPGRIVLRFILRAYGYCLVRRTRRQRSSGSRSVDSEEEESKRFTVDTLAGSKRPCRSCSIRKRDSFDRRLKRPYLVRPAFQGTTGDSSLLSMPANQALKERNYKQTKPGSSPASRLTQARVVTQGADPCHRNL